MKFLCEINFKAMAGSPRCRVCTWGFVFDSSPGFESFPLIPTPHPPPSKRGRWPVAQAVATARSRRGRLRHRRIGRGTAGHSPPRDRQRPTQIPRNSRTHSEVPSRLRRHRHRLAPSSRHQSRSQAPIVKDERCPPHPGRSPEASHQRVTPVTDNRSAQG